MNTPELPGRAGFLTRWRVMARVGVRMMFHDRLKMIGTLVGVVFAVVLSNQQAGTFLGLLYKNVMYVKSAGADIWIVPPSTQAVTGGKYLPDSLLYKARTTPGVAWAEPLLYGGGSVQLPSGGTEQVTLVGTRGPRNAGGPWNLVAGSADALRRPDTMVFEDSQRDTLGGLNLGSVREVNGHRVTVGGFTWGLIPFGPSYAFADFDTARELLHAQRDQVNYVLVGVAPGEDPARVAARIRAEVKNVEVLVHTELESRIVNYLLFRTAIGITFGTSTLFGLIVGFVIVALSMFSAVVDNLREFGTLKAIGCTNMDLALLLLMQSILYALIGTVIGLFVVTRVAEGIRSAELAMFLPPVLMAGTAVLIVVLCIVASGLALLRIRKVEPGMVFR